MADSAVGLPDQGVSPDALLNKVVVAKTAVRKALLKRHMAALDESEGLQDITTRLSQRLGIGALPLKHQCYHLGNVCMHAMDPCRLRACAHVRVFLPNPTKGRSSGGSEARTNCC